jgi:hypothetical protein
MKLRLGGVGLAFLSLVLSMTAQVTISKPTTATAQVPRLVRISGTLKDMHSDAVNAAGARSNGTPPSSVVGVTFSLYAEQSGGVPLWSEVQNVQVDKTGHYTVQLGSSKPDGLPVDLFTSAQAQWLGVKQEGQAEQPRVMLLSVPYALKAADAETFGGKPPSEFLSASSLEANPSTKTLGSTPNAKGILAPVTGTGTPNFIPLWTSTSNLTSSVIYQAASHNVGIGTTSPTSPLDVKASGTAILGQAGNAAGAFGAEATSASSSGAGVAGRDTSTSGNTAGVSGTSDSTTGTGVFGFASSTSGANFGVFASSPSSSGTGVFGKATSTTGLVFGVTGTTPSSTGVGVNGQATGTSGNAYGVQGVTSSSSGVGVIGFANSTTGASSGVAGNNASSSGYGVLGKETSATGTVFGVKGSSLSPTGFGVAAINTAVTGLAVGMQGQTSSNAGSGVVGLATSTTGSTVGVEGTADSLTGVGVYGVGVAPSVEGTTIRPIGVWGDTDQSGAGVVGTADNAVAVAGANNATNASTALFRNAETTRIDASVVVARGAHFNGLCLMDVSGNLICNGSKSAVVPVDGGARQVALYAVEAPENWFEDAGSGRLINGSAVVHLESTFAQTVNGGMEYHVFLTPEGDCKGLYVTNKTPGSFEVHELGGGASSITFDYRVMARRKGYEQIRLADKTELVNELVSETASMPTRSPLRPGKPPAVDGAAQVYPVAMAPSRGVQQSQSFPVTNKKGSR